MGKKSKPGQRRIVQRNFLHPAVASDADLPALDLDSSLRVILDGLGVNPVFFFQDPCSKVVSGIIFANRDNGLDDYGSRIDPFIGKMDRTTRKFDSVFHSLLLYVGAGKSGEQRRVDVQDLSGKRPEEFRREDPHETGHHHKINTGRFQYFDHSAIKFLAGAELAMIDHGRRDPMLSASLYGIGLRVVAEDYPDFRIECPVFDMIDNGLQIGAASRNENPDTYFLPHDMVPAFKTST